MCEELQSSVRAFHRDSEPKEVKGSFSEEEIIKLRSNQAGVRGKGLGD